MKKYLLIFSLILIPSFLFSNGNNSNVLIQKKLLTDSGSWIQKNGYLEQSYRIGAVNYLKLSKDRKYLYTFGASDSTYRKWDLLSGKLLKEIQFDIPQIDHFDISDDENTMAVSSTTIYNYYPLIAYVYIFKNDTLYIKIDATDKFSDNFSYAATTAHLSNFNIKILNNSNSILSSFQYYFEFRIAGENYSEYNGLTLIWDLGTGNLIDSLLCSGDNGFCSSDNEQFMGLSSILIFEHGVNIYDVINKECVLINRNLNATNLAFSTDSKYFSYAGDYTNLTYIWNNDNDSLIYQYNFGKYHDLKFSLNGRYLIAEYQDTNVSYLKIYRFDSGWELETDTLEKPEFFGKMLMLPDSTSILIAGNDGYLRIFKPQHLDLLGIDDNKTQNENYSDDFIVYPNPSTGNVNIKCSLQNISNLKIEAYNTLGEMVSEITNSKSIIGNQNIFWDAKVFSSGVYFIKFFVNGVCFIKPVLLIK